MEEFKLINKTRIFISSAYEDALKETRKIAKEHLEESGHEVPIFENGDFGSWEKDSLKQCLDVVNSSDVLVLLINKSAGTLLPGNVTPTYLEFKAATREKKHILVFVSPEIKSNFMNLKDTLKSIYNNYISDHHRVPDSPFTPFKEWINDQLEVGQIGKNLLDKADPFIWAFLYDIYSNGYWLYEFDIAHSKEQVKNISSMLSTSLRSVVNLIPERTKINDLKNQAQNLLTYADFTLNLLVEKNSILNNEEGNWSNFLEQGITFLKEEKDIILAPEFNPTVVNRIKGCFAASLYYYNEHNPTQLTLVGTAGKITAPELFFLDQSNVYVVEAFNQQEKLITYKEDKQTLYITEPLGDYVLCLHFLIAEHWTKDQVIAHIDLVEYAIINEQDEYFYEYLKLLIGGRT
jgi:hypothetical protein